MFVISIILFWYYNVIMAWSLYYLSQSIQKTVPWSLCGQWWNTDNCADFSTAYNSGRTLDNSTNETGLTLCYLKKGMQPLKVDHVLLTF